MKCRHCQREKPSCPRGLCWSCYYTPGVREKYPSTHPFGRRGISIFNYSHIEPPEPTCARPGTPEKVAVLERRALLGVSLWHPDDAPADRRLLAASLLVSRERKRPE
jgi:hypothetical protein